MHDFANPVFCALDTTDVERAVMLAHDLRGHVGGVKIGMEFFYAHGIEGYRRVAEAGLPVFLDLKLHDIPNTVAGGLRAVLPLKPAIVNVHAAGGRAMLKAASGAVAEAGAQRPMLIAVTILTSLNDTDLDEIGYVDKSGDQVDRLAALTEECGLDGVVCSPQEIGRLRAARSGEFRLIVPGIRPAGAAAQDQKRIMTPPDAVAAGASIIVIGRPITGVDDPAEAARTIAASIGESESVPS